MAFSCAAALIVALSKSGIIGYVLLGVEVVAIVMGFASLRNFEFLIFNFELNAGFAWIHRSPDPRCVRGQNAEEAIGEQ